MKKFLFDNKTIFGQILFLKILEGILIVFSAKFLADAIIFMSQEFLLKFFLCFAIRIIIQNFSKKKFVILSLKLQTSVRKKIHEEIFYKEITSGEILTLIFDTLQVSEEFFKKIIPQVFSMIVFIPIFLAVAFFTDFLTAIIFLITLPIAPFLLFLIGKTTAEKNLRAWKELQKLNSDFKEILSAITTLKIFERINFAAKKIKNTSEKSSFATLEVLKFAFVSSFALELLTTLSIAIVAVTLGLRLVAGNVEFFAALFLLIIAPEFFLPIRKLGIAFHVAISAKNSVEKVKKFLLREEKKFAKIEKIKMPPEIKVENLSFKYPQKKSPAISEINLQIPAGKVTAITGESGAGKSTLLKLLAGLYLPSEGEIFFNDLPMSKMQRESLFEKISYVPQSSKLFDAKLQENFSMFGSLDTQNLRIFLQELKLKINLNSEQKLSRGQLQRLGIIRVFLKNTSIIILDEPTAGLDFETERIFLEFMQKNSARKTIIIATHRQAVIDFADLVINLEVTK